MAIAYYFQILKRERHWGFHKLFMIPRILDLYIWDMHQNGTQLAERKYIVDIYICLGLYLLSKNCMGK